MQFSITIISILAAAVVAIPAPEAGSIAKRTCGTLTGEALTICQDACKALCSIGTAGFAGTLCSQACTAPPLKARETEEDEDEETEEVEARDAGIDSRDVCTIACDVLCNSTVLALEQTKCLSICKSKC